MIRFHRFACGAREPAHTVDSSPFPGDDGKRSERQARGVGVPESLRVRARGLARLGRDVNLVDGVARGAGARAAFGVAMDGASGAAPMRDGGNMPYLHDDESGVPLLVPTAAVLHESAWVLCADRSGHALWLHGKTVHEVVDLTALREQGEYQVGSTQILGDPLAAFLGMLADMTAPPGRGTPL